MTFQTELLDRIGTLALTNDAHLVINMLTREGSKVYNTAVVFDDSGQVAAKYRKYHLYGEPIDRPSRPDVTYFTLKSGLKVGLLICFDINFKNPLQDLIRAGVDAVAFPTAWYDELPFLTAPQYHSGAAIANNLTILASGLHNPGSGQLGSGIYSGQTQSVPGRINVIQIKPKLGQV